MSQFIAGALAFGTAFWVLDFWVRIYFLLLPSPKIHTTPPDGHTSTTRQFFVMRVRGHSHVLIVPPGESLSVIQAAIQDWVNDPELDFTEADRDAILDSIKHAVLPLKVTND